MADNVTLNSGTGGATAATDEVNFGAGLVHVQQVKLVGGADGSTERIEGTAANGLEVDVTRIQGTVTVGSHAVTNAGTFATQVDGAALTALQLIDNLVLAEDAAHVSGDPGIQLLAVRQSSPANLSGANGDYEPVQINAGRVWASATIDAAIPAGTNNIGDVDVLSIAAGDNNIGNVDVVSLPALAAGTNNIGDVDVLTIAAGDNNIGNVDIVTMPNVTLAAGTNTNEVVGDAAHDAVAAGNPVLVGAYASAAAPAAVSADGDAVRLWATTTGALNVADGGGSLTVDGTVAVSGTVTVGSHAVTNAGTFATQVDGAALTALQLIDNLVLAEDAAHVSGDPGIQMLAVRQSSPANLSSANGDYEPVQINAGRVWASATIDAALPAGTNNIGDVDVLTLPNVTLAAGTNTNEVVGDAAHDAAIAGNPVRLAGRALTSDYTAVAAGDTADLITTLLGKLVVIPYANPANTWSYAAASGGITNTTGVTAKAAAGAGVRNYVTHVSVINGHATVDTDVQIRDGASGTVLWRGFAKAAGGGVSESFDPPLRGAANTLVEIANGTTGSATYFNMQGFAAAE